LQVWSSYPHGNQTPGQYHDILCPSWSVVFAIILYGEFLEGRGTKDSASSESILAADRKSISTAEMV
jgi:hypothetical protein